MKRKWIFLAAAAILSATAVAAVSMRGAAPAAPPLPESRVTAPGRVEAISEEIQVSAEVPGRILEFRVREGDSVKPGQILAVLSHADRKARVSAAAATLAQWEAALLRLRNGARKEERLQSRALLREAETVLQNTRAEWERRRSLHESGDVSLEEIDRAERAYRVALARRDAAAQADRLINAPPRAEDLARARAEVAAARATLDEAHDLLAKSFVRSPIRGTIIKRIRKPGEFVSPAPDMPLLVVADLSSKRVRVDVDEADVGKIRVGRQAYVTADAFGPRRFPGRVGWIGLSLGRKNVRTGKPTEKLDTKILEVLIDLEDGRRLPLNLRVDAYIDASD